jgi:hypothetical protein
MRIATYREFARKAFSTGVSGFWSSNEKGGAFKRTARSRADETSMRMTYFAVTSECVMA